MELSDLPDQERRLLKNEDKLAIYELIASYLPSANTCDSGNTFLVYQKNDVFDIGPTHGRTHSAEEIAELIFVA